ncbi:DUF533 domain-containing protein [Acetobacteraceae bacterium H6797]|nr:DUF533 domain-containing protein [Acetobacteraceae bacterium H6797]
MNLDRIAQALLTQSLRPRRRRTRRHTIPGLTGLGGGKVALARVLGQVAIEAIKALSTPSAPSPAPQQQRPAPTSGRRIPDIDRKLPPSQASAPVSPWGRPAAPPAPEPRAEQREAVLMLRAMIATAAADGLDEEERRLLGEQLDAAGLTSEERDEVLAEFAAPSTPESLAAGVSDPVQAAQIYAGAYAAADEISPAERAFLNRLAVALGLAPEAVERIEERLDSAG